MKKYLEQLDNGVAIITHTYKKTNFENRVFRIKDPSFNLKQKGIKKGIWIIRRLIVEIFNQFGSYHSIYKWWKNNVIKLNSNIKNRFSPDIIIATYSPVECLEIGIELANLWNVPLVSDYRDGLLFDPIESKQMYRHKCISNYYNLIEEESIKYSKGVISAHFDLDKYFKEKYNVKNHYFMPNGFDEDDFTGLPEVGLAKNKLHILHAGKISLSDATSDIKPFFKIIETLIKENISFSEKIEIHQFGKLSEEELKCVDWLLKRKILIYYGEVDRNTCLAYQKHAHILLLIVSSLRPSVTPGKFYEYLVSAKSILALSKKNYVEEIIKNTKMGWVFDLSDRNGIYNLLKNAIINPDKFTKIIPDLEEKNRFNVKNQVAGLNSFLERIYGN